MKTVKNNDYNVAQDEIPSMKFRCHGLMQRIFFSLLPLFLAKMTKLIVNSTTLVVILHYEFSVFSLNVMQKIWEFVKVINCGKDLSKVNDAAIECCAFSPCGKHFAVCYARNILIYSTENWTILYCSLADRKASSLQFFPTSKLLLLADKSGRAAFYSFQESRLEKNELSLGHNSMLTGAIVTEDEQFVITCDRDEKIRVTNYPHVYNIERYCLGHKMFVSCIQFLPTDKNIIVSCSGDGTVRLWNFISGKELAKYDFNEVHDNTKRTLVKIVLCKINKMVVLAVLEHKSNQIKILSVKGDQRSGFIIEVVEVIKLNSVPWDIMFTNETLICLLDDKVNPLVFWSPNEKWINKEDYKIVIKHLIDNFESFKKLSPKIYDEVQVLFKREMDNLQEYEKKKKARLLKTGRTS